MHGYITDATYADRFFRELSPAWLNYVAAVNGIAPRDLGRPFAYLELGCGFGASSVVNAGAFPHGEFHACDLNAEHIAGAQRHAATLGIQNLHLVQESFESLASRPLPELDFIVLHGVYSWVTPEARSTVREILRRKLRPGGLAYVSYNCMPGWAIESPLRKLLIELAATAEGDSARKSTAAAAALSALAQAKLRYFTTTPGAGAAVDAYARDSGNYLAHEFLSPGWEPLYSVEVADEMEATGMRLIGSATLADNHPALVVDALAAEAIAQLPTPRQRQLATDFAVNRRFRRDVFVREPVSAHDPATPRFLEDAVIGCAGPLAGIATRATVPRGELTFQDDFVAEARSLMAQGSIRIADAVARLAARGRDRVQIARNLLFLVAAGMLAPFAQVQPPARNATRLAKTQHAQTLTQMIEQRMARALPSEVLGNGVEVRPVEALALTEWLAGAHDRDALAARLAPRLGEDASTTATYALDELVPMLSRVGILA